MYKPAHFNETDLSTLHAFIAAHPLGLLISADSEDLQANSIPFLLDANGTEKGVLRAHVARANPQWRHLQLGARALVVFQGADAYISPSWYQSKQEHGKVVPTWNYISVQVRGKVEVVDDPDWLHRHVSALTDQHEQKQDTPWAVTDAPANFIDMQKRAIVGIEMRIEEISGKWKVSQNRPVQDRGGVAAGLSGDGQKEMADHVRRSGKL